MFKKFLIAAGAALFSLPAAAQSITPDSFSDTIDVGGMTMETFTVTTPDTGPATDLVDVFFLADNTGSMGSFISAVKTDAAALLSDIAATGLDVGFGVGAYFGDPSEGIGAGGPGVGQMGAGSAYSLITPITTTAATATAGIGDWIASGGGDTPEGGLFALQQIATEGAPEDGGLGTGLTTGWRAGATKVIVWFGDVQQHTDTVDVAEAISALTGEDVIVIGISVGTFGGLNRSGSGEGPDQAADIAAATGGLDLTATSSDIVDTILAAVGTVTSTIDLDLVPSELFPGLGVMIECISMEGCDDVEAGESRDFKAKFTGDMAGVYDFDLCVPGLKDVCSDIKITVGDGPSDVPVPAALPLLISGLAGLGFASRRKKKKA